MESEHIASNVSLKAAFELLVQRNGQQIYHCRGLWEMNEAQFRQTQSPRKRYSCWNTTVRSLRQFFVRSAHAFRVAPMQHI
jgi:hypothetical protein